MSAERHLLFAVLAFESELIDFEQLTSVCRAWAADKSKLLADLLVERGWLTEKRREFLEELVEYKLAKHQNDSRTALNSIVRGHVCDAIKQIEDADIQQALSSWPAVGPVLVEVVSQTRAEEPREPRADETQTQELRVPIPPTESQRLQSRYSFISEVGKGGLGRVWLAKDNVMAREVAVKEIKPGKSAATQEAVRRLIKEAQITGQLQHPNIVPVYEVNHSVQPFYTMKLVKGKTLSQAIKEHHEQHLTGKDARLSLLRLLNVFVSVCEAMAYAHSRGVIHRDLKPLNVVLGDYGEAIVLDWGLAKLVDEKEDESQAVQLTDAARAEATVAGGAPGTPAYMAPEQAAGQIDLLDARTDIYALGVILFEVLTGRRPYEGTIPEILTAIRTCETPSARQVAASLRDVISPAGDYIPFVPKTLDGVCAKAMSKRREDRYAKATELAQDIRRWLAETSEEAARVRRLLYVAQMNLAQMAWENNQVARVLELLESQLPQEDQEDLRNFEWFYWERKCQNDLLTFKGNSFRVLGVAFIADGIRLALESDDERVQVWDAKSGQEMLTLKEHIGSVSSAAFCANGTRLALAGEDEMGTVKLWDAMSDQEMLTLRAHIGPVTSVSFSADETRLASASHHEVKLWDTTSGQKMLTLKGHTDDVTHVAFSPDGAHLASASWDQTVKIWDAMSGQETLTLKARTGRVASVSFSADGTRLAAAIGQLVQIWDATSGQEMLTLKGHTDRVTCVAFNPDGTRLASASWDRTVKMWDGMSGQEMLTLKGHTNWVTSVAFSPDGTQLASISKDKTAKVWDATNSQETLTLKGHTGPVLNVVFSPDGTRLVSGAERDKMVRVWDASSGQEMLTLNGHTAGIKTVVFSQDGKRLASASDDQTERIWDATSGLQLFMLQCDNGTTQSMAFSPDGRWLASAVRDRTVRIWDANSSQEMFKLEGHDDYLRCVVFSPDGTRLVSASDDRTVKVWNATNGQETLTLRGHTDGVTSIAFSPDGKRLASASRDQTVKVWDITSGQVTLTLKGHTNWVLSVAFSADGKRLASASNDGTAKVWDATPRP